MRSQTMQQRVRAALRVMLAPLAMLVALSGGAAEVSPAEAGTPAAQVFATVGDTTITQDEFNVAFAVAARDKFYHGKPPDGGMALLQREVADQLVSRVLRLIEARRRGLQPDEKQVRQAVADADRRYAGDERWKKEREQVLPALIERLEQSSLLQQLEQAVRDGATPTEQQVAEYYAAHSDKFTQPEQLRLQAILVKVNPSSPKADWEKAQQESQALLRQLREGADFADLARQRSGDEESASKGGDLGYRHLGTMPENLQEALKELQPGDLSEPVFLLEGFAIFRLNERKPPSLTSFEAARDKAQQMAQREQADIAWNALTVSLKQRTTAVIDESRYLPLPQPSAESATTK